MALSVHMPVLATARMDARQNLLDSLMVNVRNVNQASEASTAQKNVTPPVVDVKFKEMLA